MSIADDNYWESYEEAQHLKNVKEAVRFYSDQLRGRDRVTPINGGRCCLARRKLCKHNKKIINDAWYMDPSGMRTFVNDNSPDPIEIYTLREEGQETIVMNEDVWDSLKPYVTEAACRGCDTLMWLTRGTIARVLKINPECPLHGNMAQTEESE